MRVRPMPLPIRLRNEAWARPVAADQGGNREGEEREAARLGDQGAGIQQEARSPSLKPPGPSL